MQEIINIDTNQIEVEYEDYSELTNKKVLLLSLVNNCAFSFDRISSFVKQMSIGVKKLSFHYVTNNNRDGTVFLLESLSKTTNTSGLILPNFNMNLQNRIDALLYLRDKTFTSALATLGDDYDYTIIFDSDLIDNIPVSSVRQSLLIKGDWSSISANSVFSSQNSHYDIFALRLLGESDDVSITYPNFKKFYGKTYDWIKLYNFERFTEVKSAFGGLSIYKTNELVNILQTHGTLYPTKNMAPYTCEHILLSNCLTGTKLINPNIKYRGTPH